MCVLSACHPLMCTGLRQQHGDSRLAATEAELEQTRSHLAALQRSPQRAQSTPKEHEATFARLDTERTQVDLAFLDALAAPAFVRIAGAMNMGGGPIPTINGDYEKTTDMRNGRAVYKKVGDDKRAMWMGPNGVWHMGHVGEGEKKLGGTSNAAMAAGKVENETSPDLDRSAMGGRLHRASWGGAVAGSFSRRACRWWRSRTRWWRVGRPPLPPASA